MPAFAISAIGTDRPGIVAAVAAVLRGRGGNVEDSAMTILAGHFAIMLLVEIDDEAAALRSALEEATAEFGLTIAVSRAERGADRSLPTHLLSVYGSDHPGILAGVTAALAEAQANITDLETRLLDADGDAPVYAMVIELTTEQPEAVASVLDRTCGALGVDHTLRPIEAETY